MQNDVVKASRICEWKSRNRDRGVDYRLPVLSASLFYFWRTLFSVAPAYSSFNPQKCETYI